MKILLTGGSGFIGKNIIDSFNKKYNIFAPNHMELDLLDGNKVQNYILEHNIDIIIHSAILYEHKSGDNIDLVDTNLKMFFNIEKCKHLVQKIIYFGSGAEYSNLHYKPLMSETYFGEYIPSDKYGFAKYCMTKSIGNSNVYNLRIFAVFGKHEEEHRFISQCITNIKNDEDIIINRNVTFDYMFIDDLMNILDWFINNTPKYNVYNICTSKPYKLLEIAQIAKKITQSNVNIRVVDNYNIFEYSGDNTLILEEIPGYKFLDLEESLKKFSSFFII